MLWHPCGPHTFAIRGRASAGGDQPNACGHCRTGYCFPKYEIVWLSLKFDVNKVRMRAELAMCIAIIRLQLPFIFRLPCQRISRHWV